MDFWVIFLTGLTTGGLSCLAIQGGLLATALTRQVSVAAAPTPKIKGKHAKRHHSATTGVQMAQNPLPVVAFLVAKLLVHTLLGFLLGALGSAIRITPTVQAIMQLVAGLFMLATALNMFNVHPIFRYFVIQPPKFLTRMVRNQAKSGEMFTPAILGFMTILIPCGTTQAMEVLAISSGNALTGALILFAFVLGTSPTFFVLGFLASQIRGKYQHVFATVAAFLILGLGILSLDAGLNLLGSPLAPRRIVASLFLPGGVPSVPELVGGVQVLTINVEDRGYSPNYWNIKSGQPVRLRLITNRTFGCARAFTIPALGLEKVLPDTGETLIDIPAQAQGQLNFTCSMGMYTGTIKIS